MKTDLFQSCGHCWVFQICWHIKCSTFTASPFRIWNSSTGMPSPPLALFIVMLLRPTWLYIPGSYAILLFTASDLASITSHIHSWVLLLLWLHPFILSGVISPLISNSILVTYWLAILECEVKWALESIATNKASGGDGIPVELFQVLKDDAVKVLHSICQQIWKTQQWPQDWKMSVFIPIPKKGNAKECSNYCTIALISHASKVMLKILQTRL